MSFQEPPPAALHCPDCGTPFGADDRFCETCGAVRPTLQSAAFVTPVPDTHAHAAPTPDRPTPDRPTPDRAAFDRSAPPEPAPPASAPTAPLPTAPLPAAPGPAAPLPPAPGPAAPGPPDSPGPNRSRWLLGGGAAIALVAIAVGVFVATSAGGGKASHRAHTAPVLTEASSTSGGGAANESPSTPTTSSTATEQQEQEANSATTTTGQTTQPATASAAPPLQALDSYWADIRAHDFSGAYRFLAAGSGGLSESQFLASEREAHIESVNFDGELTSSAGSSATVEVVSLVTHDRSYGCRTWTGSYTMTEGGGSWRIKRANLIPQPCAG